MGIPVTLSPSSKHTTMTSCTYLVFIILRLLNFTLKYSRDKSHTRRLLFDCHSTVCTCAQHIILSIPFQSSLVNMASNHVHHLDKNLNDCHEHDIDWNLLPQSIREVSEKTAFRHIFFFNGNSLFTNFMFPPFRHVNSWGKGWNNEILRSFSES